MEKRGRQQCEDGAIKVQSILEAMSAWPQVSILSQASLPVLHLFAAICLICSSGGDVCFFLPDVLSC